ncbi:L-2-hydroxyglutarate dehydrogenase isoform X2 [Rhodnius prolixus]|uniref:L-2-hydroxyglutarate dehydrogenase isoform X2 n=1 Tax=Rhodnius prolixus TaxID=13249 RepID=UPI003D18E698
MRINSKVHWSFIKKQIITRNYVSENNCNYDVAIIGGGIVGTATAREILCQNPNLKCAIIEKEDELARHQSSHNSGVIHAGIYYKPGSVKAELCTKGMDLLYKYLDNKGIPYKKVGKLIVATDETQIKTLEGLYERGLKNNVKDLRMIDCKEITSIEPHCRGVKAIHSPHTGIVDYAVVTKHYGEDFIKLGGKIHYNFEANSIRTFNETKDENSDVNKYPVEIASKSGKVLHAGFVLTCAGLYADKVATMSCGSAEPAIIPFRGEYLLLNPEKQYLVKGNIYPVPDTRFPFLGVHFTPKLDGSVWLGPNAVLALKREGYKSSDVSFQDIWEIVRYKGFHKVASKYFQYGVKEQMKSLFLNLHVEELRKFIPELCVSDVSRGPSGVRAQAISAEGELVEDFSFDTGSFKRVLHCRNAPSPAATSSLAIGSELANKVLNIMKNF